MPKLRCWLLIWLIFIGFGRSWTRAEQPLQGEIEFNRDIRPILSDNCFFCHGPDKNHREADLRLDDRAAAIEAKVILPGKPGESELVARIQSRDSEEVMPPPESNKKLTDKQKELLSRWIAEGAKYQKHWAYEKPVKPEVPKGVNAIDYLVRKRLKLIGLEPSAEADRRTLARRVYFDLIGLPPTSFNMDRFVNDKDPQAYEKLVERLLNNAHYGERMAIGWLDVVRYADTIGYHSDNPRNVWPYRDWVIDSFNRNKPFDRFTMEQIAGDLMPDATQETRVGSAFNRLLLTTEEGGAQPQDYRSRMLTDRVRAVGTVWLGQTTGCAQCHDHKFDPITTRNFYQLGAFFADIKEADIGRREDGMPVPTLDQARRLAELEKLIEQAQMAVDAVGPELDKEQAEWERDVLADQKKMDMLKPEGKANAAQKKAAQDLMEAIKKPAEKRSEQQKELVRGHFRAKVAKGFAAERERVAKLQQQRNALNAEIAKCLVSVSDKARVVRVLPRGNWQDETGEVVTAAFPDFLPKPELGGRTPNRLDLAKWLISKDNPLTARVFVNRLMAQYFGTGLSKLPDDLGTQGELPVNQELLDWLACEFMDSGWDVRHMVRTIVTSQTYRQVSTATQQHRERDPENRELARQTPLRLEAELVRDNALAIAGLLNMEIGGPSVKPYQPEGYWENLNFPVRSYDADKGAAQYRRGLYSWWQRTFLHPSMLAFDATSREECTAQRGRSNLPQQALVLLNDPTYVEAAKMFAVRILTQVPGKSPKERIVWAWREALQRTPTEKELATLTELVKKQLLISHGDVAAAEELLKTGLVEVPANVDKAELAAWTHVARVLLNLHETITRE